MGRSSPLSKWTSLLFLLGLTTLFTTPVRARSGHIASRSLRPCMENSGLTATWVDISLHPNTSQLHFDIRAYSSVSGNVKVNLSVLAYGFKAFNYEFNPCEKVGWTALCPMRPNEILLTSNEDLAPDLVGQIPSVAFQVPDLDGFVRLEVFSLENGSHLACVDAVLTNGVTVETGIVSWTTAFVAGGALLWAIFLTSGSSPSLHYYHLATAKFATYSLTLFTFLQNQAMIGMTSVPLPPIVSAWTQNFMWTVGVVETNFLQRFYHWYIRSTGGARSELFNKLTTTSILVMKRDLIPRGILQERANNDQKRPEDYQHLTVKGIERVAYKAGIEQSNLFLTSYGMYIIFVAAVIAGFLAFRAVVGYMAKKRMMGMNNKFAEFRQMWKEILRRLGLSLVILGFPAMISLSLWEMTMKDSSAVVVLAVVMFLVMVGLYGLAVFRLYMILRRRGVMPFSSAGPLRAFAAEGAVREKRASRAWRDSRDSESGDGVLSEDKVSASQELKQFAILTIPYRRSGVYWVLPLFLFVLIKSALVGLVQQHLYNAPGSERSSVGTARGLAQAIGFLVLDALWMVGVSWVKPWMDKRTNMLGIAVAVIGTLNAILLFLFTNTVKGQARPVASIAGVLFTLLNAAVSLVLLIVMIVGAIYAIIDWRKGHPGPTSVPGIPTPPSRSPPPPSDIQHTDTPDPFLPQNHDSSTPAIVQRGGIFADDGRNDSIAPSVDSRDITGMQPTEPNMSTVGFNATNGNGMVTSSQMPASHNYPLQQTTSNSTQHPLYGSGVVGIGGGKSEDGRSYADSIRSLQSRDASVHQGGSPIEQVMRHEGRRSGSKLSRRSQNSVHSQRSFPRSGQMQPHGWNGEPTPPPRRDIHESYEPGMAM